MRTIIVSLTALTLGTLGILQIKGMFKGDSFAAFPLEQPVPVEFEMPLLSYDEFTEREEQDQIRDWLLLTVLTNIDLPDEEINDVTFDLPPIRYGYTRHVSNLDYGLTRSRYIGSGRVVALIPTCTVEEQFDYLAHIADEHRKNLDEIPEFFHVFQYEIYSETEQGYLTRKDDVIGAKLYDSTSGYTEQVIRNLSDFQGFMDKISDLTYVEKKGYNTLVLGGRKLKSREYGKITVEDVAAIFQSEADITKKRRAFESKWGAKTYQTEAEKEALLRQMYKEQEEQQIVDGSGFSLDPSFDCQGVLTLVRKNKALFAKIPSNSFKRIVSGLQENNTDELFINLGRLISDPSTSQEADYFLEDMRRKHQFQKARYDGFLQGTSVGMNLFYTDLIAKLWVIDFVFSAPFKTIPDFVSYPRLSTAYIYNEERKKYDNARLWFGPDEEKIQKAASGEKFLFARNATRIYAASSSEFEPGKEVPVSAYWGTALNWWNDHYEEVAIYEREYEKLNEIIKWSVIVSWLYDNYGSNSMKFLNEVKVNRSYWFPEWAAANDSLKFAKWEEVDFYHKNFMGNKTESLPILRSPEFYIYSAVQGGVSLANKAQIENFSSLPKINTQKALVNRSFLNYDIPTGDLKGVNGNTYRIINTKDQFKVVSNAKPEFKLRNKYSELLNEGFERSLVRSKNTIKIEFSQKQNQIGNLNISPKKNGFKVGFESLTIDKGQQIARELSDARDPITFLSKHPGVDNYIVMDYQAISGEFNILVKPQNTQKWLHVRTNTRPTVELANNWQARVSGKKTGSHYCEMKWMDEASAFESNVAKEISFRPEEGFKSGTAGGNTRKIQLEIDGKDLLAEYNPSTNDLVFSKGELLELDGGLPRLHDYLGADDFAAIKKAVQQQSGIINYRARSNLPKDYNLVREISKKTNKSVIDDIANAKDSRVLKARLEEAYPEQMKYVDYLIEKGEMLKALDYLESLTRVYGEAHPELHFKFGLELIEKLGVTFLEGNESSFPKKMNKTFIGNKHFRNNRSFFDEVNKRIQENVDLNYPTSFGNKVGAFLKFHLLGDSKRVKGVNVSTFIGKGQKKSISEINQAVKNGNSKFFIQDNPKLNNLDWNTNFEKTINTVMETNPELIVEKLPLESLSSYQVTLGKKNTYFGFSNLDLRLSRLRTPTELTINNSDDKQDTIQSQPSPMPVSQQDVYIVYLSKEKES